jgi:O-antigen ligase
MKGFTFYILLLFFAPLFYAGNGPLPLLLMELLALAVVYYRLKTPNSLADIPNIYLAFICALLIVPLLQLVPVPYGLWGYFAGREDYAQALSTVGAATSYQLRALSLIPSATEYAWLALLPPLAIFLFTMTLQKEQVKFLVVFVISMAVFQSVLGLMQYGLGTDTILRPYKMYAVSALGTFINRDHFAGFLEMLLPLVLAMIAAHVGHQHVSRRHVRSLRQRLMLLTATHVNKGIIYGVAAIFMFLALIFTQSRTGVALGMLLVILSAAAFATRLGGKNVYGLLGSVIAVSLVLAFEVGMVPVISRFVDQDPLQDGRWLIYKDVLSAIGEFFPLGSGFGTFIEVFPRFQTASFGGAIVNSAHNDYLEWIMEGGIFSAILMLIFMMLYLRRWPQVWKRGAWRYMNFVQVGAGIGMFCIILHSFVDFNLHIPANQIYFALLAGLFFYSVAGEVEDSEVKLEQEAIQHLVIEAVPVPEPIKSYVTRSTNPFSE